MYIPNPVANVRNNIQTIKSIVNSFNNWHLLVFLVNSSVYNYLIL